MRHTVVVSDVHLSQTQVPESGDALWMRYRFAEYHPDGDFELFVDRLLEKCDGGSIELVFNGDVFDFDAPLARDGKSTFEEYPLDDAGCAAQAQRICEDHPRFLGAVKKLLAASPDHRVLFLSGNHDIELYWPGVRRALRSALGASEERVRFRAWFHVTEDKIYLEHGSQYDMLNGVPDPMTPLTADASGIKPVCGKLAFKRTGSRMGYFNPYYEETFYMGLSGYLRHFAAHYMFSKRHIIRTWAGGALATAIEVARHRTPGEHELPEESLERAIEETGATREQVIATHALRVPSGERTMLPILRELWIDRVALIAISLLVVSVVFVLTLSAVSVAIAAGVVAALFVGYEIITPKPDIRTYDSAPLGVRRLLDIHDARVMCMGHTHRPFARWEDGKLWANSGAWCPAFADAECTKPVLVDRPFLWFTSETDEGELRGGLHWLRKGAIEPDTETGAAPESAAAQ